MSLGVITDTLDSKLSKLRSGSESNDENGSPIVCRLPIGQPGQPLRLHSENIPFADESPERHFHNFCPTTAATSNNDNLPVTGSLMVSRSCTAANTLMTGTGSSSGKTFNLKEDKEKFLSSTGSGSSLTTTYKPTSNNTSTHKLQHSATAPINSSMGSMGGGLTSPPNAASTPATMLSGALKGGHTASTARNLYATSKNLRFSSSVYEQRACSEDDSEGSTTSDPKEALVMASPSFLLDKYNKKRRDHRLFRSASFNCRNYSSRYSAAGANMPATGLTKDEKTDMNLTKKRQIQNKQNRSIKRRHTVGGPHDYGTTATAQQQQNQLQNTNPNNCNHYRKNSSSTSSIIGGNTGFRRMPLTTANVNICSHHNNNNNMQHDDVGICGTNTSSNGNNSSCSNSSSGGGVGVGGGNGVSGGVVGSNITSSTQSSNNGATVNVSNSTGEHVLEVGIRIKNINRGRF